MALTVQDLQPKDFKINVKGVELTCKPPKLSHMLVLSKVGNLFQDINSASRENILSAQSDFNWAISELIPELQDIDLDMQSTIDIITEIMKQVQPEENIELEQKGVKFDTDPKVEKVG
jgi:hypothetical protein